MFRYYSVLYKLIRHDSLQLCMVSINHLGHQIEVVRCYMTKVQCIYEQAFISFSLTTAPRFNKIGYFWYLVHFFVQLCQDEISHPKDFLILHLICRYTIISSQIVKFPASKHYQKVSWHLAKMACHLTCRELYVIVSLDQ